MSSPQKGVCLVCGADTGDRRRARCDLHPNRCKECGRTIRELRYRYCRSCGILPHLRDSRTSCDDGIALVRRLHHLRQRAAAESPLFERSERAKAD